MNRRTLALLAFALALAVSLPQRAFGQWRQIHVGLTGYPQTVLLDTLTVWTELPAPTGASYSAARVVLDSIRIPVSAADSVHGLIMNSRFVTRRRLLDQPMSKWFRCGSGITGGDYADSWRISVAYALFIDPLPENRARLGVAIAAAAMDIAGASKPMVTCASTGALETHLTRRVLKALAESAGTWAR